MFQLKKVYSIPGFKSESSHAMKSLQMIEASELVPEYVNSLLNLVS